MQQEQQSIQYYSIWGIWCI